MSTLLSLAPISTPVRTQPVVLMERNTAGILVELVYLPLDEGLEIRVTVDEVVESARVPNHRGRDAFDHPYCYLPR